MRLSQPVLRLTSKLTLSPDCEYRLYYRRPLLYLSHSSHSKSFYLPHSTSDAQSHVRQLQDHFEISSLQQSSPSIFVFASYLSDSFLHLLLFFKIKMHLAIKQFPQLISVSLIAIKSFFSLIHAFFYRYFSNFRFIIST